LIFLQKNKDVLVQIVIMLYLMQVPESICKALDYQPADILEYRPGGGINSMPYNYYQQF